MTRLLSGFLTLAAVFGWSAAEAQTALEPIEPVMRPGDLVEITVWRQPEISGQFEIAADGTIQHPIYRVIEVADVPLDVVRARVGAFLKEQYDANPRFIAKPLFRVAVGGEVRQPNLFNLSPQTTIAQAVALAGGPTERGHLEEVRLLRGGREIVIDLSDPESTLAHSTVLSGDQIMVSREISIFRDYIAPAGSITAALAAVLGLILR